ncbi:SelT/SelW/SelH family protein [Sediminitomix flava]|uniref:Selenoprotein W-related protein n=1 Tax=Sediminitomix flava TaxID=379075 RepID=A0A315YXD6_SEDFL|nr:SelT/SelW/SelH family protein [Sediminitomix flava]PWJ34137.1 selenoprotein W-related protein [Sediminitomix flava]
MDKAKIEIKYCTLCGWLLRASWMSQELLTTFSEEISSLSLTPTKGGIYEIWINDELVFSFKEMRRFPQPKEIKQMIRDRIAPERDLGHSDRK